jgi:hypothetical protein
MRSNCRRNQASYDHESQPKASTLVRVGWVLVACIAAVVVPLRIAEIAAAHHPGVVLCVATASDASPPTFAFSHASLNQGNLKDE